MNIIGLPEIRRALRYREVIGRMREALIANSRGECDTPMPMHLDIAATGGEVHIKSSYRRGGKYFALKVASTFPGNVALGRPTGNGMMLLCSAETGEPVALLADEGHLTDVRTAAVAAMVVHELRRKDTTIGILGTGIQARLQARMLAHVLEIEAAWIWGRKPERLAECCGELQASLSQVNISPAANPAEVARNSSLIVTATASRQPLLGYRDLQPGTLILAVGSDSAGKHELDAKILRRAALLLVDSRRQCEKLGELQHAPEEAARAIEIGAFVGQVPIPDLPAGSIIVADFTGLGVEDLYIAAYCYERTTT